MYYRRWFILKANLLFYQERPADQHLLGVIVLEGCAVRMTEADVHFSFSLVFPGPRRKNYGFAAADRRSQESWVKTLLSASHCYLCLLLRDLRGQYEGSVRETLYRSFSVRVCWSWLFLCSRTAEAKRRRAPESPDAISPEPEEAAAATVVRKGRGQSGSSLLQAPLWFRGATVITPPNATAASRGEPEDFRELHDYYGREVKKAREEWLKGGEEEQRGE